MRWGWEMPASGWRCAAKRASLLVLVVALTAVGCVTGYRQDSAADRDVVAGSEDVGAAATEEDAGTTPGAEAVEPEFRVDPDCFDVATGGLRPEDVTCGTLTVPLRHEDPAAGTIELAVAVLSGSDAERFDHPTLLLGGGPGGPMVETYLTSLQARIADDVGPDLIVLDQRGVGLSRPALDCPELGELGTRIVEEPAAELTAIKECRDRLRAEGIELDAFHHLANARDVDLVRRALGEERVDVRGISYGTVVALLAAAEHPEGIRSLVLDAPIDPTMPLAEEAAEIDRMVRHLDERCRGDEACIASVGDLEAALDETLARLAAEPEQVTVIVGHHQLTVTVGPEEFAHAVFSLAYDPEDIALLPATVRRAREGDLAPLLRRTLYPGAGGNSHGMGYSMACSGVPDDLDTQLATLPDDPEHLVIPLWLGRREAEICAVWDVAVSFDPGDVDLDIEVPTLIVTGGLDLVTPPLHGERVHAALPASQLVEVPDSVHTPLTGLRVCGREITAAFLLDPEAPVDASCIGERSVTFAAEVRR
jgi:pimeloyl-ACP methyl ester carboxylesterase